MPVVGLMPNRWSGAQDIGSQIWNKLGLILISLLLLWSEHGVMGMGTVSYNKGVACVHLKAWM
jgi:hypothetical protein